jgi:hypothetical protein
MRCCIPRIRGVHRQAQQYHPVEQSRCLSILLPNVDDYSESKQGEEDPDGEYPDSLEQRDMRKDCMLAGQSHARELCTRAGGMI